MIPTRRLVILLLIPLAMSVVSIAVKSAEIPMFAVDLVILLVAAVDALLARSRIEAVREVQPVQSVGRSFPVLLTLRNRGRRRARVQVTDAAPGSTTGLPVVLVVGAGRQVEVTYEARVDHRGEHAFGPVTVRSRSPLGLFDRQVRLKVEDTLRVYPNFEQLRSWGLRAREDERRLPVRVRRRPGGENEFQRLRPYVAGDSYRHIDWRATARRQEFITREYGQESNQNVIFLLDCGRMMSSRSGDLTAFDHALNAALMMGQVALRHGDRVGLLAFDTRVRAWMPPKGGARSGSRLIRGTYDLFPSLLEPDYALALRYLAQHVRRRSLVVLLTAVVDEVNADMATSLVGALTGRHVPLSVWIRDVEIEGLVHGDRATARDHYVAGAAAELLAWRERSLQALRHRGALVVDCAPGDLTPALLSRYLEVKARRLL